MLLISIAGLLYLLPSSTSAISVQNLGGRTLQLPATNLTWVETFPNGLSSSNESFISLNATVKGDFDVRCYGTQYGFNPNVADCQNAINYVQRGQTRIYFAERETSPRPNTFRLPFKLMGGKLSWNLANTISYTSLLIPC